MNRLTNSSHQLRGSQRFENGEIHQWYRLVWGYPDHLVAALIERFKLKPGSHVLDPFAGSGTTLVEALKFELEATGIDANPVAVLAARVKSNWRLNADKLRGLVPRVLRAYDRRMASRRFPLTDSAYRYIVDGGMLDRGWITRPNLRRALALKGAISAVDTPDEYRDALRLALLSTVVHDVSNIRYGPELYCGALRPVADADVAWAKRVFGMGDDLEVVSGCSRRARVLEGDARAVTSVMRHARAGQADAVICSPPYPAEHDYTRNTRLELAFLECVTDLKSLRIVKRRMIRSHTKNIYVGDDDGRLVKDVAPVERIARRIARKVRHRSHGFARYYEEVIREYFGGMARHFRSLRGVLRQGARCAYVVGEQASYASTHVPTADLLAVLAKNAGFRSISIDRWRDRKSTTTDIDISESILVFRQP